MINNVSRTKPMEILLVEDGLTDAKVTIHALRSTRIHHRLTLVRTIVEAKAFLNQEGVFARAPQPDLMLLDMILPDGLGVELLEFIHSMDSKDFSKTTVAVLTASDSEETREQCSQLGVTDYIPKPVHQDEFLRVVRDHKKLMIHSTPVIEPVL